MILKKSFFEKSTPEVAKNLLGCYLVSETPEGKTVGKIVETEAYLSNDPAAHSFIGQTKRNSALFEESATIYIYFIYGMYYCLNVVTSPKGTGEAVLIRALEPIEGIKLMEQRRKTQNIKNLCNGPGKLVQALGITPSLNGSSFLSSTLKIYPRKEEPKEIISTQRIGISKAKDLPLRFYISGNEFISKK